MSVIQTYKIAHQARGKLAKEANCPDHNLHRLVCLANMLDALIFDLAKAEEAQESYLNKLTSGAQKPTKMSNSEKRAQLVMEKLEDESESDDGEDLSSDEDSSDEEFEHWENKAPEKAGGIIVISTEEQDSANELQEKHAKLALERTKTRHHHSSSSPPKHTKSVIKSR